jgi:hypothetical protein
MRVIIITIIILIYLDLYIHIYPYSAVSIIDYLRLQMNGINLSAVGLG